MSGDRNSGALIDAGTVPDGNRFYRVAYLRGEHTLAIGDRVMMRCVGTRHLFVRPADMSIHSIFFDKDQYIILTREADDAKL